MLSTEKTTWFNTLATEASRDLVFAWNIARGSFGGLAKEHEEVAPGLFREAVEHLLAAGSKVGFGDPDSDGWRELEAIGSKQPEQAGLIAELWASRPDEYEFLVFAIR